MRLFNRIKVIRRACGQVWVLFAVMIPVLLAFAGMTLDLGNAYLTKTTLSKAVDAAALAAMNNLNQGQGTAKTIATSAFNANFGSNPPPVTINYTTDSSNDMLVNVSASTTINTMFLRLVTGSATMSVGSSAQATRNPLVMSLVLDKSGSMMKNGGQQALPPAVKNFIGQFDDSQDHVADVSFSTGASVDVKMTQPFASEIDTAVSSMPFGGGTYAYAGMVDAQTQIQNAPVVGPNVRKVVVFFTDGWANMVQDSLVCNPGSKTPTSTTLEFGGCAPLEGYGSGGKQWCGSPSLGIAYADPSNLSCLCWIGLSCGCMSQCNANSFPSQQTGGQETFNPQVTTGEYNVANEAMYRTVQLANSMRQSDNIVVYSIGMGDLINQSFLQQVANDPASSTYDPSQPVGEAVFAPDSSQLDAVFQVIAAKILLRLTR